VREREREREREKRERRGESERVSGVLEQRFSNGSRKGGEKAINNR